MPLDRFDREINYLRISVIDACNLRCTYCMPLDGLRFLPSKDLLTPKEIGEVVRAAVDAGFRKFRLTGGEPTLRRDLADIVREIKQVPDVGELAMTTNGLLLPRVAPELAEAGLDRVNLHIDTLNADRLKQLMRRNDLDKVMAGIEAAEAAGLTPIKLNTVVVRDLNDQDVVDLAALTVERPWHVRFIELMPLGAGREAEYSRDRYVPNPLTQRRIEAKLGALEPIENANPSDESRNFRLPNAEGVVGFISPVSAPFCGTCNRLRLTPEGRFHLCLLKNDEVDVRHILRDGGGRAALTELLQLAIAKKPIGHELHRGESNTRLNMHQIGG